MSKILTPTQLSEIKERAANARAKVMPSYEALFDIAIDIPALLADREERDRLLLLAGHYSRVCACESCERVRAAIGEPPVTNP